MKTPSHPENLAIHYDVRGQGPALLLVHGFSASSGMWPASFVEDLAVDHRVITFDFRGTGQSDTPQDAYDIDALVTDALTVLDAADVGSAVVLGYSMGGMVAQQAALTAPDRVAGLVLSCTAAGGPETILNGDLMGPLFGDLPPREAISAFWSGIAAPGYARAHPEVIASIADAALRHPTPAQTLGAQGGALQGFDSTPRLGELRVPTRVVHGLADPLNDSSNAQRLAAAIDGAELTLVEGAGHLLPWEAPSAITAAIRSLRGKL